MKLTIIAASFFLSLMPGDDITSGLQQKALSENKNIAVYFCGSDWCSICYKFKEETLQVPVIDSLINADFVYYTADFPQRKKLEKTIVTANEFLAEKLNPAGEFPVLVITDANWNVKAKIYRGNKKEVVIEKLTQSKNK